MRQRILFTLLILTCALHAKPSHNAQNARTSHPDNKETVVRQNNTKPKKQTSTSTNHKLLGGLGITALSFILYKTFASQQDPTNPANQPLSQQNNTPGSEHTPTTPDLKQPSSTPKPSPIDLLNQPNNTLGADQTNTTPEPSPIDPLKQQNSTLGANQTNTTSQFNEKDLLNNNASKTNLTNNTPHANQPNTSSIIDLLNQKDSTPDLPKKTSYTLTKEDVNTFYNLNQAYFDLDQLIPTQTDWQLDDHKMNQWVARMENAWQHLSQKRKDKWINYWLKRWIPKKEREQKKATYKNKNILRLFAEDYTKRLVQNFVTWDKFKAQIQAVGEEAAQKMESQQWKDIFFLVPGGMEKSNPWIFFVFWKHLKDHIPSSATCHFVSHKRIDDMNEDDRGVGHLLQGTTYKAPTSLVFIFDDMSYSGEQMERQLRYFKYNGHPPHLYIIMPYLTHRAKRQMTGMDPRARSNSMESYYTQNYVQGKKHHHKYPNETEQTWFAKTRIQFMKSTQIIQEILIKSRLLGAQGWTTTPTALPFKIADHASILCAVIAYGFYPMKKEQTQAEINQFKPMSFFQGHDYNDDDQTKIREELFPEHFTSSDDSDQQASSQTTLTLKIPLEFPNHLLPIQATYKNRTFTFKVKENDTIVEKQYSNANDLKRLGVFYVIGKNLSGT